MMHYQPRRRKMTAEINVVPYIDVMLVLLVIFMVTSPFVSQGVDVELPTTTEAKSAAELSKGDPNFIIIEVDKNGAYRLSVDNGEKQPVDPDELLIRVKAEMQLKPDSMIMVGGDAKVAYSHVIMAIDLLHQAGVESVGLMTKPIDDE